MGCAASSDDSDDDFGGVRRTTASKRSITRRSQQQQHTDAHAVARRRGTPEQSARNPRTSFTPVSPTPSNPMQTSGPPTPRAAFHTNATPSFHAEDAGNKYRRRDSFQSPTGQRNPSASLRRDSRDGWSEPCTEDVGDRVYPISPSHNGRSNVTTSIRRAGEPRPFDRVMTNSLDESSGGGSRHSSLNFGAAKSPRPPSLLSFVAAEIAVQRRNNNAVGPPQDAAGAPAAYRSEPHPFQKEEGAAGDPPQLDGNASTTSRPYLANDSSSRRPRAGDDEADNDSVWSDPLSDAKNSTTTFTGARSAAEAAHNGVRGVALDGVSPADHHDEDDEGWSSADEGEEHHQPPAHGIKHPVGESNEVSAAHQQQHNGSSSTTLGKPMLAVDGKEDDDEEDGAWSEASGENEVVIGPASVPCPAVEPLAPAPVVVYPEPTQGDSLPIPRQTVHGSPATESSSRSRDKDSTTQQTTQSSSFTKPPALLFANQLLSRAVTATTYEKFCTAFQWFRIAAFVSEFAKTRPESHRLAEHGCTLQTIAYDGLHSWTFDTTALGQSQWLECASYATKLLDQVLLEERDPTQVETHRAPIASRSPSSRGNLPLPLACYKPVLREEDDRTPLMDDAFTAAAWLRRDLQRFSARRASRLGPSAALSGVQSPAGLGKPGLMRKGSSRRARQSSSSESGDAYQNGLACLVGGPATTQLRPQPSDSYEESSGGGDMLNFDEIENPHLAMDEVIPAVFCGSREPATDPDELSANRVQHIVSCVNLRLPMLENRGWSYTLLDMKDVASQPLLEDCERSVADIHRVTGAGGTSCLVHCGSGVSRAPAIIVWLICATFNLPADIAGSIVRVGRPTMCLNDGFRLELAMTFPDEPVTSLQP